MKVIFFRTYVIGMIVVSFLISGAGCGKPTKWEFELTKGWHQYEAQDSNWHRWMSGRGTIRVFVPKDFQVLIQGEIISMHSPDNVEVIVNGQKLTTINLVRDKFEFKPLEPLSISLKKGDNLIELVSQMGPVTTPADPRPLAVAVKNLRLSAGNNECTLKR
jgi:hypothetical protein